MVLQKQPGRRGSPQGPQHDCDKGTQSFVPSWFDQQAREGPRAYLALLERQAAHVFRGSARGLHAAHVSGGAGWGCFILFYS